MTGASLSDAEHRLLCEHYYSERRSLGIPLQERPTREYVESRIARYDLHRVSACDGRRFLVATERLTWDSQLYQREIFAIRLFLLEGAVDSEGVPELQSPSLRDAGAAVRQTLDNHLPCADVVFARLSLDGIQVIQAFEAAGFRCMDVQCTLSAQAERIMDSGLSHSPRILIRGTIPEDLTEVAQMAEKCFLRSHMYANSHLPTAVTDHLHRQWAINDCNGRAAVALTAADDGVCAGFITLLNTGGESGRGPLQSQIDLLAVREGHRGHGIAGLLVREGIRLVHDGSPGIVTVGTQANNYPALKLYQKLGFQIAKTDATLHYVRENRQ